MTEGHFTREQLMAHVDTDPIVLVEIILRLQDQIDLFETRIKSLELNSRNSSKPPSTDKGNFTNPPNPKSQRKKSGRKPEGQKGHKGSTLNQVSQPDHVVEHFFSTEATCPKCMGLINANAGQTLAQQDYEKRQVFELPPVKIEVTEHRAQKCDCSHCGEKIVADFPQEVKAPVQYGSNLQATALYFGSYQLIPYQRLGELFQDLFACKISAGTLANFVKRGGKKAAQTSDYIREALKQEPVIHLDETGCRQDGKRHWLHVVCTNILTFYLIDPKRGRQAMLNMGILEDYRGKVVHDFWRPYYFFKQCKHFLCNAHIIRELEYIWDDLSQPWAKSMYNLLLEAKKLRTRENARAPDSRKVIGKQTQERIERRYDEIIKEGYKLNPEPTRKAGQRGRLARGKALNMLRRLDTRRDEIFSFFTDGEVPFDNNQAERDLRMMKTREKISGTFRSEENAQAFCALRSVISTARKQSYRVIDILTEMMHAPESLGKKLTGSQ